MEKYLKTEGASVKPACSAESHASLRTPHNV